jgi:hypothetical protein
MNEFAPASMIEALITRHLAKTNTEGKAKAGESGNLFEAVILAFDLPVYNYYEIKNKRSKVRDIFGDNSVGWPPNRIERNVPYDSVLQQTATRRGIKTRQGTPHTEYVLVARDIEPTMEFPSIVTGQENRIRIECKYQNVSGTTESKLLHSYLDLQYGTPESNVILLVDGKGFTEKMKTFIREVCEEKTIKWTKGTEQPNKRVVYMDISNLSDWANRAGICKIHRRTNKNRNFSR